MQSFGRRITVLTGTVTMRMSPILTPSLLLLPEGAAVVHEGLRRAGRLVRDLPLAAVLPPQHGRVHLECGVSGAMRAGPSGIVMFFVSSALITCRCDGPLRIPSLLCLCSSYF